MRQIGWMAVLGTVALVLACAAGDRGGAAGDTPAGDPDGPAATAATGDDGQGGAGNAAPPSQQGGSAVNTLDEEERAAGWRPLFDGDSLDGWRGYRRDDLPARWRVEEGAIHFDPQAEGEGGDLITVDEFADFELRLQWRISPGGNSGIFFRVDEEHDHTWESGPEMQVLDDAGHRDGLDPRTSAASNYALHAPSADVVRPAGAWNDVRIVVDGSHVEHWLNGTKVVEYELWSDDWKRRVADSKFADMPDYGRNRSGHIALQDHGDPVWYRDIAIRPLAPADAR